MARSGGALQRSSALGFVLAALLLAAPAARAAVQRELRVPGSARPGQLYARSDDAFASPKGSRPLLLILRGFSCAFTPVQLSLLPPGALELVAAGFFTGSSAGGVAPDDFGVLAKASADALDVIALALDAPRSTTRCAACVVATAAARSAPADDPERAFTLAGAALFTNATAAGINCPAWDATDVCCQATPSPQGDVPFLLGALDAALREAPAANASAVIVFGASAGGFMAHRLACDAPAGRIAALVSFAGGMQADEGRCNPKRATPVLVIHGKRDLEVPFSGSAEPPRFPGAEATLAQWARKNKCGGGQQRATRRGYAGAGDTDVEVVAFQGCAAPLVEGWFVQGFGHLPPRSAAMAVFLNALRRVLGRPLA